MDYSDFHNQFDRVKTKHDKYYEEPNEYCVCIKFSLNGLWWHSNIYSYNIPNIMLYKKDMPPKLLFKNIDIIKEYDGNQYLSFDRQYFLIDTNDFFYKLTF